MLRCEKEKRTSEIDRNFSQTSIKTSLKCEFIMVNDSDFLNLTNKSNNKIEIVEIYFQKC